MRKTLRNKLPRYFVIGLELLTPALGLGWADPEPRAQNLSVFLCRAYKSPSPNRGLSIASGDKMKLPRPKLNLSVVTLLDRQGKITD